MAKKFEMSSVGEDEKDETISIGEYKKLKKQPLEAAEEADLIELGEWKRARELSEAEKEARDIILGAEKARDDLVSEDDWKAREEEGARLLQEFDKAKEAASSAAGEIEAKEPKPAPEEPKEKVIVEMAETEGFFELKKLSEGEIKKRMIALSGAMDKILLDAAEPLSRGDKSALKKWMKKGGEASEWPLDDIVTAENYKEQLVKYGIADFIDSKFIGEYKDAYAVVNNQFRKYQEELAGRKKGKSEKEAVAEIEAGLPEKGEGMPWELKRKLGEDIEVSDKDIVETENLDAARMEEIRENLEESEEERKEAEHELEKKIENGRKKGKGQKKKKSKAEEDVLGIGEVLREEAKEHEKKVGMKPQPKEKKKKGFWTQLFGTKK